ncbi:MAG: nuclear transport factor 2 family protein [bacterium]
MKRILTVSLLMIAAATIAFGQCSDADKMKLEAFDRAWGEAGVRGDRTFLQNVYADNYVGLGSAGMADKTQTISDTMKQFERDKANPQNAPKVTHDYYMITCSPTSATITHRNVITENEGGKEHIVYTRSVHFLERKGDGWHVVSNAGHPLNDAARLYYMEREWNDAAKRNDVAWFERNYAEDASDISSRTGVQHSKAEEIASMKDNKTVLDSLELSDLDARVEGNAAVVTGVNHVRGKDDKGVAIDRRTRFTDTFIKRDGRWLVWATQGTLIQ